MSTQTPSHPQLVELDRIKLPGNVRPLDATHVDALAGSIALRGQLVPVIVRPDGEGYVLVAGFHRYAAHRQLARNQIAVEIRDGEDEHTDRAVENIARKQLNPFEEAQAVKDALDNGLTEDGAAQALGWPRARVTARVKLLELPEAAQQLVGAGVLPLSSVDQLRAIGRASAPLLDAVVAFIADGNEWAAERLTSEPGWVLDSALRAGDGTVFAAHLSQLGSHEIAALRLGKRTEALLEEAATLHRQLDRYAYGPPPIRFSQQEIDQARAAGVTIEFERSAPIIVERSLYRELAKAAIKRTAEELRERTAALAAERNRAAKEKRGEPVDPVAEARQARQRQLRELAVQAHGVNLDLGAGLLTGLSTVDPADIDVARFFVFALLGADHDASPYTQTGERIAQLAVSGIRLVIEEFRTDQTKTRRDGSRGVLRMSYGDPRDPARSIAWLWKFIDGAKTAGELYGRALVVIAAEQYASRLVLPGSQRSHPTRWPSHKDKAAKALRKLAGPHLPASLRALQRAVERAHSEYATAEQAAAAWPLRAKPADNEPRPVDQEPAVEAHVLDAETDESADDLAREIDPA